MDGRVAWLMNERKHTRTEWFAEKDRLGNGNTEGSYEDIFDVDNLYKPTTGIL